jgi:hypothetical protein
MDYSLEILERSEEALNAAVTLYYPELFGLSQSHHLLLLGLISQDHHMSIDGKGKTQEITHLNTALIF